MFFERDALRLRDKQQEEDDEQGIQAAVHQEGLTGPQPFEQGQEGDGYDGVHDPVRSGAEGHTKIAALQRIDLRA